jgi:hypothetical protein
VSEAEHVGCRKAIAKVARVGEENCTISTVSPCVRFHIDKPTDDVYDLNVLEMKRKAYFALSYVKASVRLSGQRITLELSSRRRSSARPKCTIPLDRSDAMWVSQEVLFSKKLF